MINYNNKIFIPVSNSKDGESSNETIFYYKQEGDIITSQYFGGEIIKGQLMGIVDEKGNIDMRYHHINKKGQLMTGKCRSVPEILENGKIRLHENWEWTSGNGSKGQSIIEEQ